MKNAQAEVIALQALAFLAADEDLLLPFLAASGCSMDEIRASARDPAFLGGVLDFMLQEDRIILNFCEASGLDPAELTRARHALPGSPGFEF
jgi:Protein of unknown function (DUF3572)